MKNPEPPIWTENFPSPVFMWNLYAKMMSEKAKKDTEVKIPPYPEDDYN